MCICILCTSPTYANSFANQYESGKITSHANGGEYFVKNPFSVLVIPQDRINAMRYDNICELIRTEHELIGCNRMAIRYITMYYGLHGEPVRMC